MPVAELTLQRRVEFHDTDRVGMVHFSNYFRYMDTTMGEFFRSLGLPGPLTRYWGGTKDDELDWPYASVSCDFKKPLQFDDVVEIRMWIKRIGTKSLTFGVSFRKEGEELAQGQCVVVCSQGIQGQPRTVEIPSFLRERLSVLAQS
jgi:YbgC/YbaW family acyl-CoA thioester hydrolase